MKLEVLPQPFTVCKVADYRSIDLAAPFVFTGATDAEKSLVCPTPLAALRAAGCTLAGA